MDVRAVLTALAPSEPDLAQDEHERERFHVRSRARPRGVRGNPGSVPSEAPGGRPLPRLR